MNSKLQDRFGVSLHVSFLPFVIQLLIHPQFSTCYPFSTKTHLVIDTQNDSKTCKPKKIIAEHPTIFNPSQSQTLKKNKIIQEEDTDFFLATLFAIFPTSLPTWILIMGIPGGISRNVRFPSARLTSHTYFDLSRYGLHHWRLSHHGSSDPGWWCKEFRAT